MKKIIFGLIILMLTSVMACTPKFVKTMKEMRLENPETQADKDQNIILDYLITNEIEAQKTESGIWYVITEAGEGDKPNEKSKVKAHYNGTLMDSTTFDSSYDRGQPLDFALGQVIKGWQEAIKMLGKGGKGTFYIPSELAYGERGAGAAIPANTVLKFDIELIDFEQVLTAEERVEKDQETIKEYLANNNIEAQKLESGIWYVMTQEGEGKSPSVNATVTAHYSGRLLDGKKFDSSYDRGQPFTTTLNQVIVGWKKAIPTLKKGGKGTFYIPSGLAYGEAGAGQDIPANSVLIFDIELVDFQEVLEPKDQAAADAKLITDYLTANKINAQEHPSGIWYTISTPGIGGNPNATSKVKTHYKGMLMDGKVFDSSYDRGQPLEFGLNQVIQGWQIAIPMLQKGGKGTFYIPSGLAYGTRGAGGVIPANAVLIFDVELLDFK
jgi:FKBP-type peptidyl-prolyl cis-trans isomerase